MDRGLNRTGYFETTLTRGPSMSLLPPAVGCRRWRKPTGHPLAGICLRPRCVVCRVKGSDADNLPPRQCGPLQREDEDAVLKQRDRSRGLADGDSDRPRFRGIAAAAWCRAPRPPGRSLTWHLGIR